MRRSCARLPSTSSRTRFEVVEAGNGREALRALQARPDICAVLTDVHMPGKPDGFGVARHALEVCPDCAVVIVSGRGAPTMPELDPRVRFMSKPYTGDGVVRAINAMLTT